MTQMEFARKELNLSIDYVSHYLDISPFDYTLIEAGRAPLSLDQEQKLEKLFLVDNLCKEYHAPNDEEILANFKKWVLTNRG